MGLKIFASFLNATAAQTAAPTFEGVYYVSTSGTGNGLTPTDPMSYATLFATVLPDNTVVRFKTGEES